MKIGFLAPHRWQKQNPTINQALIKALNDKGHTVVTSHLSLDELVSLNYVEREAKFMEFYKELEEADIILAECTIQSTQVGFGLAYLRSKGKPVVIFALKEVNEMQIRGEVYSNVENLAVYEYTKETIKSTIDDALSYMEAHLDKRFTIIFPSGLMSRLEEISKTRKLPKAVYIRQLIEEDLKKPEG